MRLEINPLLLTLPANAAPEEHAGFMRFCRSIQAARLDTSSRPRHADWVSFSSVENAYEAPFLAAAAHVIIDLLNQGWSVAWEAHVAILRPPSKGIELTDEKERIQVQELVRRDQQLARPSVRHFVEKMEKPRAFGDSVVSIFSLIRDGAELADSLRTNTMSSLIKPYVQIAETGVRCAWTGFLLTDIWRYFRHTWSSAYSTVPGRSMPILIRDAATQHHAVIGISAISSPVVQIDERDRWIKWRTEDVLDEVEQRPTLEFAAWLERRLRKTLNEIFVDDFLRDGVIQPSDLRQPSPKCLESLQRDADQYRSRHHRGGGRNPVDNTDHADGWLLRAQTPLFRHKRAVALIELLKGISVLQTYLSPSPSIDGLALAMKDPKARAQIGRIIRRARGERVGTVIADLTVCGAIAPYSALAAGKLVGALSVSPMVLEAYRLKYDRPSEIASSMAGRAIVREARLAFIGTTSLYGTGSSQYNRLFWPADTMGGSGSVKLGFFPMGRSRAFGTSQFSDATVEALVRVSNFSGTLVRVNSVFGEGVSPRLRKVRLGLAALGWPSNQLLQHGRERILYGVPLVSNLRDYALGIDEEPDYLIDACNPSDTGSIAGWWIQRWGLNRAAQERVQATMRSHTLTRPIRHGARVPLPRAVDSTEVDAT